jgi:hypothetical protein
MTLRGSTGGPLRADNTSSYAYFATDDALTQAAEVRACCTRPAGWPTALHPPARRAPASARGEASRRRPPQVFTLERAGSGSGPVQLGELVRLKNLLTGMYGRVGAAGSSTSKGAAPRTATPSSTKPGAAKSGMVKIINRGLLQTATSCTAEGLVFDQASAATASSLTYTGTGTGTGLSYNGVPLVQTPGSNELVASSDPACSVTSGSLLTFSPAVLSAMPPPARPPGTCQAS